MGLRAFSFAFVFILFSNPKAAAAWRDTERSLLSSLSHPFADGIVSTIWSFFHLNVEDRRYVPSFQTFQVKNPEGEGYVPAFVSPVNPLRPERKPLLVFFPGMFAGHNGERLKKLLHTAHSRGFHCLSLANPWSPEFIRSKTGSLPGNVRVEAKALKGLVQKVISFYFGPENVSSISLMGESYGAFMAAIVAAEDEKSNAPLFDGSLTLLHPPLDLVHGMAALDHLMDRNREKFLATKTSDYLYFSLSYVAAKNELSLSPRAREHAGHLLAYAGFNRGLYQAIQTVEEVYTIGKLPHFMTPNQERDFQAELRFRSYLNSYYKTLFDEVSAEEMSLLYWLDQLGEQRQRELRILTAADDFLNVEIVDQWNQVPEKVFIMPDGGHSAVLSIDDFYTVLKLTLSHQPQPSNP